MYIRYLFDAD